jgi:hypothetical protein
MILNCSSRGFRYEIAASSALDKNPTNDSRLEITPEGVSALLVAYRFTADCVAPASPLALWASSNYSDLPRVEFQDSSASPSVVFGSLASFAPGVYNLGVGGFNETAMVNIPGRGVLFDNGLSITLQSDAVSVANVVYTLSVVFQK